MEQGRALGASPGLNRTPALPVSCRAGEDTASLGVMGRPEETEKVLLVPGDLQW